jgi:DNA-binding transcriptional MerR regulator
MRKALILLPLVAWAVPAAAQSPADIQLPRELTDPATADRLADAMQALSKVLLDLKVGEVQAALEGRQATPAEKQLTIRDVGKIDEAQLDQQMAQMKPQIKESMKAFQKALPEMMKSLEQAQKSLERVTANIPDPTYPKR